MCSAGSIALVISSIHATIHLINSIKKNATSCNISLCFGLLTFGQTMQIENDEINEESRDQFNENAISNIPVNVTVKNRGYSDDMIYKNVKRQRSHDSNNTI